MIANLLDEFAASAAGVSAGIIALALVVFCIAIVVAPFFCWQYLAKIHVQMKRFEILLSRIESASVKTATITADTKAETDADRDIDRALAAQVQQPVPDRIVTCPTCQHSLKVGPKYKPGARARCPRCKDSITV